jgi:hypothetical protein
MMIDKPVSPNQEMQALLKILTRGERVVAAGKVKPVAEVIARLRDKRKNNHAPSF